MGMQAGVSWVFYQKLESFAPFFLNLKKSIFFVNHSGTKLLLQSLPE
jgi:hypothetical protein